MTTVGVWCRRPSFADIELAASLGFTRLDVMVNEMSKARGPTEFVMDWSADDYRNIVGKANMEGISEVHFTSWIMPHVTFASYAGDALQQLCLDTGADGIVLDAEEPWTKATKPDYGGAAEAFYKQAKGCRVGITGIGYANFDKLQPLMECADYGLPQCYSTNTSKVMPDKVDNLLAHWRRFDKPLAAGLAAYRQSGIKGYTTRTAMTTAFGQVAPYVDTVVYWSLRQIKGSVLVQDTLRKLFAAEQSKEGAA